MSPSSTLIYSIVSHIQPYDELEAAHKVTTLSWIQSGAPLFRIAKPDTPPQHLVSYFVLYDKAADKLMLIDHVKAKAWLPTGGHVEINEDPRTTVLREAREELGIEATFTTQFGDDPLFITATTTRGYGNHTDISFWYIINGDSTQQLTCDPQEMHGYQWLTPANILAMDIAKLDPHMHRFVQKMSIISKT